MRKLLTLQETGACLNVSRSTVYRLIGKRRIVAVSIERKRLVTVESVDRFIADLTKAQG